MVKLQQDCGLQVVTDGEFRRISYWEKFVRLTAGLEVRDAVFTFHDAAGPRDRSSPRRMCAPRSRAASRSRWTNSASSSSTAAHGKITMPAPSTMHFYRFTDWGSRLRRRGSEFFADLGKVYQAEIAELAAAGCRYVQLDEVAVAILCDPAAREKVKAAGEDPDRLVDLYIDAINEAVKKRRPSMTVGVHVCRGNYKGMYLSEGGYDSVAEKFFNRTNVDHFLLEFDTPRAGGFRAAALRAGRQGRGARAWSAPRHRSWKSWTTCAAGPTRRPRYIDASRLAISPQCGFASTMGGNPVTEADERAKLKLCVDAAAANLAE